MRDKLFQKILDETPEETKIFVRLYADLVKRISYTGRKRLFPGEY